MSSSTGLGSAVAPEAAATMQRRRLAATDLHFAFGHLRGVSGLTLVANGTRAPLSSHTEPSRAALKREGGLWAVVDLSKLTHYVSGVELPADRGVLVSVQGERENREVAVGQMWHVPPAATVALAEASYRATGSFGHVLSSSRLAALGVTPSQIRSAQDVALLATIGDTTTTAVALAMLHPNIATKNAAASATTTSLLEGGTPKSAIEALAKYILQMQTN